jgi:hypothetical protein
MSSSALTVVALATLASAGLWLSMLAAANADVDVLPAGSLRRLRWWQAKARNFHLTCAMVAIVAVCVQVGTNIG